MKPETNSLFLVSASSAALFLAACTTQPLPNEYDNQAFLSGDALLECTSLLCASKWRLASDRIFEEYAANDWHALARSVEALGYGSDLAYFYLARAADELGATGASSTYFQRAAVASRACAEDMFGGCNGIDVEEETQAQLRELGAFGVRRAQTVLASLGLYNVGIDGVVGPRTIAALEQFQKNVGLRETGALNAETRRALLTVEGAVGNSRIAARSRNEATTVAPSEATRNSQEAASAPLEQAGDGAPVQAQQETASMTASSSSGGPASAIEETTGTPGATTSSALVPVESMRSRVILDVEVLSEADPFSPVVAVVKQGEWVEVLARGSEWARISHDQATGYVYSEQLQ